MALIFGEYGGNDRRGTVQAIPLRSVDTGSLFQLEGWGGISAMRAMFTRIAMAQQTSFQTQVAFGDRLNLNVFGDEPGSITMSGMSFHNACDGQPGSSIGLSRVLLFFEAAKLSRNPFPLRITIDPRTVYLGYLHSMAGEAFSGDQTDLRTFQFSLNFLLVPPRKA